MEDVSVVKRNYINYIDKLIKNDKISHAYLIEVDNYEYDFKYVFDFIKMILCNYSYQEIKNKDNKIISLIDSNNYPDIKIIEPDGNWIKKSQLLDLQKDYSNKSIFDNRRIYIIKEAEKLNSSSANTILKFLEEPEQDIIAFLITDNRYHVIDTIMSRCQILTLKENELDIEDKDNLIDLLDCILKPRNYFIKYNFLINDIIPDKVILKERLDQIEYILITYLNFKFMNKIDKFDEDFYEIIRKIDDKKIIKYLFILEKEVFKLEYNVNYKLWLDSLFSRLIGVEYND